MRVGAAEPLCRIRWWLRRLRRRLISPPNVVRLCRRRTELISIINEAIKSAPPWTADLIERVVEFALEGSNSDLSVYEAATTDPLDHGHALSVIAEGIAQEDFRVTAKKRKRGGTRGTLSIPTTSLPTSARLRFTPENNLNFFPADDRHYDLSAHNVRELATVILNGIHNRTIWWTFLANEDGSYRLQAAVAYSYCLSVFGRLDQTDPPSGWRDGRDLSRAEQIEILRHLANTAAIDSPMETS